MLQFLISRPTLAALLLIALAFAIAASLAVARGLSSRRKAQAAIDALRQSEARYRILADNAGDVIIHHDPTFRPLYISPSVRQLGYDAQALMDRTFTDFVHPEDQGLVVERRRAAMAGEPAPAISARICRSDGEWVWFESTLSPILGEGGAPAGFVSTLRDISERRMAEQAVDESQARYRMLADNASDVIIHYDLEFRPLYMSPSMGKLGHDPKSLVEQPHCLDLVHPDDQAMVVRREQLALTGVSTPPIMARLCRADGGWVWFESTLTPVHDDDGAISSFISTLRDISKRRAAEQAVIDSEARYRMLADNVSDIIVYLDTEFRSLYISPSMAQLGYEPATLLGTPLRDMLHPDDVGQADARRAAALNGQSLPPVTVRILRADGEWIWFERTLTAVFDEHGKVSGFVSVMRDISERRAAEQAVIDSEARYRMLADNVSDVLLRYDTDLRIDYASPSVSQWGYKPEDFIGQRAGVFVHPDDQKWIAVRRVAMMRGDDVLPVETRIRQADGSWTWVESRPALARDKDGKVVNAVVALRDINHRKRTEEALVESEARYRMLADNTSDIIQRFNAEGVVEYMSPSVRQLGYEPEFFLGRGTALIVDNADQPEVARRREDLLAGRPVPPLESRVRAADGRMLWLESRPSPILDDKGKLVGVVNVMRDVTARKAAEAAMQELDLELRRVARASTLGAFAASLAHEINQPLAAAAISGEAALRWLSSDPVNYERGVQAMKRTVDDVRRAADVIGRMRAMVTKEEPRRVDFDAVDAVREVLALTERERDRFGVRVRPGLDPLPIIVHGDRVQFQQVMINLILNGVEAMRDTPERDRVLVVRAEGTEGQLDLAVEDRGPGVDPDKREQIFESLFTTKIGGTGLGLHISRSIVETHGGRLWVESGAQSGAVFKVRMPATLQKAALGHLPREAVRPDA
jgi:PAS domain S-box-containing protein